jgi:protein O-mannosyl-transferase
MKKDKAKNKTPKKGPVLNAVIDANISVKHYAVLIGILLLTFISYLPLLHNGLLNWDDVDYIQTNPFISTFNLKELFSGYYMGNYHPLTMLIYSVEYHLFGMNPAGFHAVSLLLHLCIVVMVFYVVFLLGRKTEIALVVALLFGLHTVHVESVAWASELKDMLFVFFFLASYIFYLNYLKSRSSKYYIFSLLMFLFSLFSKAVAVSLPVVLLLTDYFVNKDTKSKNWGKLLFEKVPFLTLSIVFGIIAVYAQRSFGSLHNITVYTFPQRIVFACYGFITYLFKILLPVNLSAFYPYPVKSGAPIPVHYYLYPAAVIGLIAYAIYSVRFTKKIFFGIAFFGITVFVVLQLLAVGDAVMADRYSYLPSLGILYLAAEGFYWLWNKSKVPAIAFVSVTALLLSVATYSRCGVWKNDMTLWTDVINQQKTAAVAYNNRGSIYMDESRFDEALRDFNKAIELKPEYSDAYNNRGKLLKSTGRYEDMLSDFNKAIESNSDNFEAHNNRGNVLCIMKKYDEAIADFNSAIALKPEMAESYNNRGTVYITEKKYTEAIVDMNKAIELKPDFAMAYANRGLSYLNTGKKDNACNDFRRSIELGFQPATDLYNKYCQ